jgi:hypothetical protein
MTTHQLELTLREVAIILTALNWRDLSNEVGLEEVNRLREKILDQVPADPEAILRDHYDERS